MKEDFKFFKSFKKKSKFNFQRKANIKFQKMDLMKTGLFVKAVARPKEKSVIQEKIFLERRKSPRYTVVVSF
jgi:hypothetical protein